MNNALLSSKYDSWETPPYIVDSILSEYNREEFDLDPCCTNLNIPARFHIKNGVGLLSHCGTQFICNTDGLSANWGRNNVIFVNPPYGRELMDWATKCAEEGMFNDIWLLCPARTDTVWFQTQVIDRATEIYFVTGRITFHVDGQPFMILNKHGKWQTSPSPYPAALVRYCPSGMYKEHKLPGIAHRYWRLR